MFSRNNDFKDDNLDAILNDDTFSMIPDKSYKKPSGSHKSDSKRGSELTKKYQQKKDDDDDFDALLNEISNPKKKSASKFPKKEQESSSNNFFNEFENDFEIPHKKDTLSSFNKAKDNTLAEKKNKLFFQSPKTDNPIKGDNADRNSEINSRIDNDDKKSGFMDTDTDFAIKTNTKDKRPMTSQGFNVQKTEEPENLKTKTQVGFHAKDKPSVGSNLEFEKKPLFDDPDEDLLPDSNYQPTIRKGPSRIKPPLNKRGLSNVTQASKNKEEKDDFEVVKTPLTVHSQVDDKKSENFEQHKPEIIVKPMTSIEPKIPHKIEEPVLQSKDLMKFQKELADTHFNLKKEYDKRAEELKESHKDELEKEKKFRNDELEKEKHFRQQQYEKHLEELEKERRARNTQYLDMENTFKKEKERMRNELDSELTRAKESFQIDLDRKKREYESDVEAVKRENERIKDKMRELEHEIKEKDWENDKLKEETRKIKLSKVEGGGSILEVRDNADAERKFEVEKNLLETEKHRVERWKDELNDREKKFREELRLEKETIKGEYARLSEFQEALRVWENEKKREIELEKEKFHEHRENLEKEGLELKEEYFRKYKDFELELAMHERKKDEFNELFSKREESSRQKIKELDSLKARLANEETQIVKRMKNLDIKEFELGRLYDEYMAKHEQLLIEKKDFEKEVKTVNEISHEVRKESEFINDFKKNFDLEKEKLKRMRNELDSYARTLFNEKSNIDREKFTVALKEKTLDSLRGDVVRGLDKAPVYSNPNFNSNLGNPMSGTHPHGFPENISNNLRNMASLNNFLSNPIEEKAFKSNKENEKKLGHLDGTHGNFNVANFVQQLKNIDESLVENQAYLSNEKDAIMKKKIDLEDRYLNKLKSSVSNLNYTNNSYK